MFRKELKYIISESKARSIRHALLPFAKYDPYSAREKTFSYATYSLYMDTAEKLFFYDKLDGANQRIKIRFRTYKDIPSNSVPIFLEFKNRYADTFNKKRLKISLGMYRSLLKRKKLKKTDKNSLLNKFYMINVFRPLQPSVLVSFYREAFFANNSENVRINFDRLLSAKRSKELFTTTHGQQDILNGAVIFEIKFPEAVPYWLVNIIKQYNLELQSFSKYCTGLSHCDTVEQFSLLDSFNTYV